MQRIAQHLWYDKEAKEAAQFYVSLFEQSKIMSTKVIKNPPPFSDAEIVNFQLAGQQFFAISAGPYFQLNPTISLMVACFTPEEVDRLWEALSEGGTELMALGEYPFSKRYAWVQDRYGLSWQLMLVDGNKAKVNFAAFQLDGLAFCAMDNRNEVDYTFNEAFSLIVNCKDQQEIDYFWDKLSAVPEAENCGWCKDQFGVSWQVLPYNWEELLFGGSEEQVQKMNEAVLKMKKFDLAMLEKVRLGVEET